MNVIWLDIWKPTVEKSQTNAANVTLHLLGLTFWGHIWEYTVVKSQTNAADATLHPFILALWGHIWEYTVEKSQTIATSVSMPLLGKPYIFMPGFFGNCESFRWKYSPEVERKVKQSSNVPESLQSWLKANKCLWKHCLVYYTKIQIPVFYFQKFRYRYLSQISVYRYFPVYRRGLVDTHLVLFVFVFQLCKWAH